MEEIIKWTNENSGFLSLIIFIITIVAGWVSGLFKSLIKKPKLKIRFIPKMSFFSFFHTGEKWINKELNEELELHKTGFASYMSIANIGNKCTSIDKIWIGYYKNVIKKKWFKKEIQWLAQWHPLENFKLSMKDGNEIVVNNLRVKNNIFDYSEHSELEIGKSLVGVAYFEQVTAWGNLNPAQKENGNIDVIIKIRDIYGKEYKFQTELEQLPIEEARKFNPNFGNIEQLSVI
ncbi:MAG: hypothetical protein ACERIH_00265 [Labilibaculum antarcticum]